MKKSILIIIALIITLSTIKAQDKEPSALYFKIPRSNGIYNSQFDVGDPEYKQTKIMTGWQWYNHPRLTTALDMNFAQGWQVNYKDLPANTTGKEIKYIWQIGGNPNPMYYSNSFTYKPTIRIDTNSFTPDTNDSEKNIWGFLTRNITNPQVENNKLVLTTNLANVTTPILSNPWRGDSYLSLPSDHKEYDKVDFNGKYWKVSINLRRRDFIGNNNLKDTMPILKIKMPYILNNNTSNYINFSTKPDTNFANKVHLHYVYDAGNITDFVDRGYCLAEVNTTGNEIIITRAMLPNNSDTFGQDITLTFSFINLGQEENNPLFRTTKDDTTPDRIKQLGMEVYYLGNCDILLNYIRVGNPLSDKMWKGELDTLYQRKIQEGIDTIYQKNYRLFRFYGRDEIEDNYHLWDAMRYFNKLVGGMMIIEGNSRDPRYLYRAEADYTWFGSLSMGRSAVPHFRRNENEIQWIDTSIWEIKTVSKLKRMNSRYGYYRDIYDNNKILDTLSNAYELSSSKRWFEARKSNIDSIIYLDIISYSTIDTNTHDTIIHYDTTKYIGLDALNIFTNVHKFGWSPQWVIEWNNYLFHTLEEKRNIVYSGNVWWQNYFNFGEWIVKYKDDTNPTFLKDSFNIYKNDTNYRFYPYLKNYARPFIGEETRWSLWRTLIYGGKGFAFDGQYTQFEMLVDTLDPNNKSYSISDVITTGIGFDESDPNLTNDYDILYGSNQKLGYDFIPEFENKIHFQKFPIRFKKNYDSWEFNTTDSLIGINRKEISDSLGCKENRIYIGRQSNKTEMKKFFNYLANDNINSTLFDLRLAGAISNGIRFFQSWDNKLYSVNPLKNIIKYSEEQIYFKQPITSDSITLPS
ncbi:TPA: hypothetical protein ENS27_16660, partial [bacterium]|nr:hypothetical protein [bacterium]